MKRLQLSVEEDIEGLELSGRPWRNGQAVDLLRPTKFFLGLFVTGPGVYKQDRFASFIRLENFLDPCLRELTGHKPALGVFAAQMSELLEFSVEALRGFPFLEADKQGQLELSGRADHGLEGQAVCERIFPLHYDFHFLDSFGRERPSCAKFKLESRLIGIVDSSNELQTRRILQDQTGAISVSGGSHLNLANGC